MPLHLEIVSHTSQRLDVLEVVVDGPKGDSRTGGDLLGRGPQLPLLDECEKGFEHTQPGSLTSSATTVDGMFIGDDC